MEQRLSTAAAYGFLIAATLASGAAATDRAPAQRAPVVVQVGGDGFHWGDAAIGAAVTLGATAASGGVLVLARSRPQPAERNHHG
jgi:hypothetical protein